MTEFQAKVKQYREQYNISAMEAAKKVNRDFPGLREESIRVANMPKLGQRVR